MSWSVSAGRSGGMADAAVSKTVGLKPVWVRLPPSAPCLTTLVFARKSVADCGTIFRLVLLFSSGAWLSLVERSVRDAEAGGSNPLAPTKHIHTVSPIGETVFLLLSIAQKLRFGQASTAISHEIRA